MPEVSVAIPVRNGGAALSRTLVAVCAQSIEHELLVCASGSTDGSADVALAHGARVLQIDPSSFTHGGVRNLLMRDAEGARVAFLTQDAQPADEHWLRRLLGGFELAQDVGIVYGPYIPYEHAALPVRRELERWFDSLSPDGRPRVERLGQHERSLPAVELIGRRGFFSDANGCVARAAWEQVPFREVPYAEDRVLALDMLRAGFAKAYVPAAAVLHSHDYSTLEQLRRSFDEWRGLREVYGWREPASPARIARRLRGELAGARRRARAERMPTGRWRVVLAASAWRSMLRLAGALLGSRADRLPAIARRLLSLARRGGFAPLELNGEGAHGQSAHTE